MLTFMRDLHRYTARKLGDERMWPLSMPCYIAEGQDIELAQYGTSNTGRFKTLYREG
ncbi:gamma-glutamylcysteine synthetase [Salmonella enterica subsp. arizonae]|uniref:Glutamate--cysteine ligase n=16 Tax=Salmonella enterica TaxID=28901 RepID=A0A379S2Q3_SALER|nr:gamma-glutamylcysteine synthetase [Salmonella enterica subsp. arizonae]